MVARGKRERARERAREWERRGVRERGRWRLGGWERGRVPEWESKCVQLLPGLKR